MRSRSEIEEDSRDGNISYGKLILEVLLDIREELNEMREYLKHRK